MIKRSVIFCPKDIAAELSENIKVRLATPETILSDLSYLESGESLIITEDIDAQGWAAPLGIQLVFIEGFPTDEDFRNQIKSRFNRISTQPKQATYSEVAKNIALKLLSEGFNSATKDQILNTMGKFTWMFGTDWFVQTEFGNFHWKDPDYDNGDNTFTFFNGTYDQFRNHINVEMGRDKGHHNIERYCGNDIKIIYPQD